MNSAKVNRGGIMLMMEGDLIDPWRRLLRTIAITLTNEELKDLLLTMTGTLSSDEKKNVTNPGDFLQVLENKGLIGEDKTDLLKELFTGTNEVLLEHLEEYVALRERHLAETSQLSGCSNSFFVGRDSEIKQIKEFFMDPRERCKICCVCLWGMAGCGKTALAAQAGPLYANWKTPRPIFVMVDLNKKTHVEDVGLTLLSSVGCPVSVDTFSMTLVWEWINSCQKEHVLLFDNADTLLKPHSIAKDKFRNWIEDLLVRICPNSNAKIIITSRYRIGIPSRRHSNFMEIELRSLALQEAVCFLTKMVGQGFAESIAEEQAIQLAELCGNNPLALVTLAKQIQMGRTPEHLLRSLTNPKVLERELNYQGPWKPDVGREAKQVLLCLEEAFQEMNPALRPVAIRLSVLPGLFSQERGQRILENGDNHHLRENLDALTDTGLLTRESLQIYQNRHVERGDESDKLYSMHPLVRCLCLIKVHHETDSSSCTKKEFSAGLKAFMNECFNVLKRFTSFDDDDAFGNLTILEKERINLTQYLELEMRLTSDGKPHPFLKFLPAYEEQSNISSDRNMLVSMERFMFPQQREMFFKHRAEVARVEGDVSGWINYMGWYAETLQHAHEFEKAEKAIEEPLHHCKTHETALDDVMTEGYSQCLYVKGLVLLYKPTDIVILKIRNRKRGWEKLNMAMKKRSSGLGDSIVTARSINAVGSCLFWRHDFDQALEKYQEAKDMMERLTDGVPEIHPDYAHYVLNVGTCYHEMGCKYMNIASQKEKSDRFFNLAIENYNEGIALLEDDPNMKKSAVMGLMLKNKAMTYCEMKDYKEALCHAEKARRIREDVLGDGHPNVARAHYFTGSLYMSLGDIELENGCTDVLQITDYKEALKCFKKAFDVEMKVGYARRSMDYDDLKRDMKKVLNLVHEKTEWQLYSEQFERHERSGKKSHAMKRPLEK